MMSTSCLDFNINLLGILKDKTQFAEAEQASQSESDMAGVLELSNKD